MVAKILFVDDQPSARMMFERIVEDHPFEPLVAASVVEAEELLERNAVEVIVTDLRMPKIDGIEGLKRFRRHDPEVPIILVTAFGTVETAVEAMKAGAFDYIRKPFEPSELLIVIERALRHRGLVRENRRLRSELSGRGEPSFICRAPEMRAVLELIDRAAPTDYPVLIEGESGVGKDVVAGLIHRRSRRAEGPLITLNCSAIPEHLLESELFGHERGAFSGATSDKPGFFAKADGGTLFLDEIGDMSLELQPKLLRVLQEGEFYPVGSRKLARTSVRLICASNQDIPALVKEGRFRQDLYYRINTVRLELPPLRQRPEEIEPLAEHFCQRLAIAGNPPRRVSTAALELLRGYAWPGNVRELAHAIEVAALVSDSDEIQPEDLPPEIRSGEAAAAAQSGEQLSYRSAREAFERDYFARLLDSTGGNIQRTAELAGIHRTTLYDKLAKLGVKVNAAQG